MNDILSQRALALLYCVRIVSSADPLFRFLHFPLRSSFTTRILPTPTNKLDPFFLFPTIATSVFLSPLNLDLNGPTFWLTIRRQWTSFILHLNEHRRRLFDVDLCGVMLLGVLRSSSLLVIGIVIAKPHHFPA